MKGLIEQIESILNDKTPVDPKKWRKWYVKAMNDSRKALLKRLGNPTREQLCDEWKFLVDEYK